MFTVRKAQFPAGLVAVAGLACGVHAQVPAVPAAPAVPGGVPAAPAAAAAEPAPGFFGRMCQRLDACKRKIADTPLGQLLANAKKPLSALTGGVVPGGPPAPTDKEAAAPGVGGAAAAGKKDAAEAKKRVADVQFLGTLDCRYYPAAAQALADALRTDPSECVRFAAAVALNRACCCSAVTVKALMATVSGTDADGNPAERSARVRVTACSALERCLACYTPPAEDVPPPKTDPVGEKVVPLGENKTGDQVKKEKTEPAAKPLSVPPSKELVRRATETVESFRELMAVSYDQVRPQVQPPPKSLFHLVQASEVEPATAVVPAPTALPTTTAARPALMPSMAPSVAFRPAPPAQMKAAVEVTRPTAAVAGPLPAEREQPKAAAVVPAGAVTPQFVTAPADRTADLVKGLSTKVLQGGDVAGQHQAIRDLVKHDWKRHPLVASTLLLGAKTSQFNAAVRVDCLRHLAAYAVTHRDVIDGVAALAGDPDRWVREEAAKAAEVLTAAR